MPPQSPSSRKLRAVLLSSGEREHFLSEIERVRPLMTEHVEIVAEDYTGQIDISAVDAQPPSPKARTPIKTPPAMT